MSATLKAGPICRYNKRNWSPYIPWSSGCKMAEREIHVRIKRLAYKYMGIGYQGYQLVRMVRRVLDKAMKHEEGH